MGGRGGGGGEQPAEVPKPLLTPIVTHNSPYVTFHSSSALAHADCKEWARQTCMQLCKALCYISLNRVTALHMTMHEKVHGSMIVSSMTGRLRRT